MKALITVAIIAVLMAGCVDDADRQAAADRTAASLSRPEQVGVLPDGRPVMMATHYQAGDYSRYIYFVEGGGTTVTDTVPNGKTTRQQVTFTAPVATNDVTPDAVQQEAEQKLAQAEQLVAQAKVLLQK